MKNTNKYLAALPIMIMGAVILVGLTNCRKTDQVLDTSSATAVTPILNTDTLYVAKGTATLQPIGGGAWDGTIEGVWGNASKLTVHATVPDLGNGTWSTWEGYVGQSTDITLRALYDATNIYFLAEFRAEQMNVKSAQFYFNPTTTDMTKKWAQEAGAPALNSDGSTYRPPFQQDGFVMAFNISCQTFDALSCYAFCHKNSSYGSTAAVGGAMYTNGPNERCDIWRARMLQVVPMNQANDCFLDDGSSVGLDNSGQLDKLQVHNDWQTHNGPSSSIPPSLQSPGVLVSSPGATPVFAADGGFSNKQVIHITGAPASKKATIPIWIIPAGTYTNSVMKPSDTLAGGGAVKVMAVDSFGVLTLADATTIDPRTSASGTDYQQIAMGDGPKCIPGTIADAYTASRGDITANAFYTGAGWRMLLSRKLNTGDLVNDVDFSTLKNQPFGIGTMFNGANSAHAIVAGLMMSFKK